MVRKKYELYQIYYKKQYQQFQLFKLRLPTVTLFLHSFTPALVFPLILFRLKIPTLLHAPSFLYSTQPVPKHFRLRFIEDTFVFPSNVQLSRIEV